MTWQFIELAENIRKDQVRKPVVAYMGEEIRIFPSIQEAGRAVKGRANHICQCVKGKRITHMGYYWRYI